MYFTLNCNIRAISTSSCRADLFSWDIEGSNGWRTFYMSQDKLLTEYDESHSCRAGIGSHKASTGEPEINHDVCNSRKVR
jgi:hypothetical protein